MPFSYRLGTNAGMNSAEEGVEDSMDPNGANSRLLEILAPPADRQAETSAPRYHLRPRKFRGRQVDSLHQLDSHEDYILVNTGSGLQVAIRRTKMKASSLYIDTHSFYLEMQESRGGRRRVFTLIDLLNTIFTQIYTILLNETSQQSEPEIQVNIKASHMNSTMSSGIVPLKSENGSIIISEIISQLLQYSQSESRTLTLEDLKMTFVIGYRRLGGEGYVLPLGRYYTRKPQCW